MPTVTQTDLLALTAGVAIVAIVAAVIAVIALISGSLLRRRFKKWKSIHSTADLEAVYEKTLNQVASLQEELTDARKEMGRLQDKLRSKVSTVRIKRYNAFAETGSDLSFSVALLDDEMNGAVISSIYGREESRTYAKPVANGTSNYTLTDEEQEVLGIGKPTSANRKPVHV